MQRVEDLHFWAPLKRALSLGVSPTSMILAPASSCMIRPEVTMGEMPSSIRVPGGAKWTALVSLWASVSTRAAVPETMHMGLQLLTFDLSNGNGNEIMSGLITTLKLDYFPCTRHKRTLGLSLFISSTSVGSQNYSHPVEGICWIWWHDAKKRNLNLKEREKMLF